MSDFTAKKSLQRRTLLKGAAAASGALAFPFVRAADPITLRYLGTAVNQDKAIADKFKADTGITIQYIPVTTDDVTKRAVTAPNSFDLIDTEYFSLNSTVFDVPSPNVVGMIGRTPGMGARWPIGSKPSGLFKVK